MDHNKKQYVDMVKLIGRTLSCVTVLNTLNTIDIASSDPWLKLAAQTITRLIREIPDLFYRTKLCLQIEAERTGGTTEHECMLKDWVVETKKYCEQCLAAVVQAE